MDNDVNSLVKQVGVTAALLGGAVATCASGSFFVSTIIGGVLTNILSNKVEQTKISKIRDVLSNRDPSDLNHDLEKLIQKAIVWATKNICYRYEAYCENESQRKVLKKTSNTIIKEFESIDSSKWKASMHLLNQIDDTINEDDLVEDLITTNAEWPEISPNIPFPQFYETQFVDNFKLCFGELLKDPDNKSALIAYNRTISTNIQKKINQHDEKLAAILESNKALMKELGQLGRSPIENFEKEYVVPEINIALDSYLKPLHDNVSLLVDMNGEVLIGIEEIKKETQFQTQKIEDLSREVQKNTKTKVLFAVVIPVLAIALSYFVYQYWLSLQPFVLSVYVDTQNKSKLLKIESPEITIHYDGKTESKITQQNRAVFNGLPSKLRKDSIRLEISSYGFQHLDTTIANVSNISLALKRDDTFGSMHGRVKDDSTGESLSKAKVTIANSDIVVFTDNNGKYKLVIPDSVQRDEQRLLVSKEGFLPWEKIEPVLKNHESIIRLQPKK